MDTESRPQTITDPVSFVIPYYDDGLPWRRRALAQTLASIRAQTDDGWRVHLADDASPAPGTAEFLQGLADGMDGRMTVLAAPRNAGAGAARNLAIEAAERDGCVLLAYLDADDLAHPERVATSSQKGTTGKGNARARSVRRFIAEGIATQSRSAAWAIQCSRPRSLGSRCSWLSWCRAGSRSADCHAAPVSSMNSMSL